MSTGICEYIYETVTWKAKEQVTDEAMIEAATAFGQTLKSLSGFLHQALYKGDQDIWVSVYYWETEADAKASNEAVAGDKHFARLLELIEPESIAIRLHSPLQQTGHLSFH